MAAPRGADPDARMIAAGAAVSAEAVLSVIAEVTRYPRAVLLPEAVLEDDLGIDSLKRVEIWAELARRFDWQLPGLEITSQDGGLPNLSELKLREREASLLASIRTVGDIVRAARELDEQVRSGTLELTDPAPRALPTGASASTSMDPTPPAPSSNGVPPVRAAAERSRSASRREPTSPGNDATARAALLARLAQATDYPIDVFFPSAQLEDDLGLTVSRVRELVVQLTGDPGRASDHPPATVAQLLEVLADGANAVAAPASPRAMQVPVGAAAPAKAFHVSLANKVALVTGSGRGIGKAIAHALAEAGATVVINTFHSRQQGEETTRQINEAGGRAIHCWGSVAKPEHLTRIFETIDHSFGGLDLFVSNASNGALLPTADITPEYWERAFRTNVIGFHQAALLAAGLMRKRGGGKIIALSSIGAQRVINYFACMGTVKAAVESLTRYLAVELSPDGIDVLCLSAGAVEGELLNRFPDRAELKDHWRGMTLRGRFLTEAEYAEIVAMHLAMPARFQGQTLFIDDGGALRV